MAKTGQTKKLLKLLNADACCIECPTLSQDDGNVLECREDGLYAPEVIVPDPVNENPFILLQYKSAELYIDRYFSHNGITVVKPAFWTIAVGSGISFTMGLSEFAYGGFILSPIAGAYTVTVPTAANIKSYMGITAAGAYFDYTVVNSGGGAFTLVMNTNVTSASALTGGTNLVVAPGKVGVFRFVALDGGNSYQVARIM